MLRRTANVRKNCKTMAKALAYLSTDLSMHWRRIKTDGNTNADYSGFQCEKFAEGKTPNYVANHTTQGKLSHINF